jgi:acetyl-CoA synthetase
VNFVRDVLAAGDPTATAVVERTREGGRRVHQRGALADRSARLAGTFSRAGVRQGDVVLVLIGSRIEWVEVLLACFGAGYVALPCTEQLRAEDLRHRIEVTRPALVVADERNRSVLEEAAPSCPVVLLPDPEAYRAEPQPWVELAPEAPCLLTFTSGSTGLPKAVLHAQRYLPAQTLQAEHWLGARPGDLVWCTAATGWSKSARNAFIAPWVRGAACLLHDARFDADERLAVAAEEQVSVLCMAPTEYRMIARRTDVPALPAIHSLVAAGESLDGDSMDAWQAATGLDVRDGYGQTELGQVTGNPVGRPTRRGSMGPPLPGVEVDVRDGELVVRTATLPTCFLGYVGGEPVPDWWATGDQVRRDEDGYLYFESRADDVIVSAGYRIGPAEVEKELNAHPSVAESAVVAAPDAERGEVVKAFVVLREGVAPAAELVAELQQFVRDRTAPYKYPRQVVFERELPKTVSGKIRRAQLRGPR